MASEIDKLKSTNRMLIVALIIGSFFLGSLTNRVATLEKNGPSDSANVQGATIFPTDSQQQPTQPSITIDKIKALFNDKNLVLGDKNSKNLLVEIADPSCPYCQAVAGMNPELNKQIGSQFTLQSDGGDYIAPVPEMKKLVDQGKAAFVYIYAVGHGAGEMGTKALYCANEQGKFWQVHDLLMSNAGYNLMNNDVKNDKTKSQQLVDFLSSAADNNQLKQCIDSGKYDKKLSEDTATASSLGFRGTPDFYINTTNFPGAQNWKNMQSAVK